MKKIINTAAFILAPLDAAFIVLYFIFGNSIFEDLAITFSVFLYHIVMRLGVGFVIDRIMKNTVDYNKAIYRVSGFETKLYQKLKFHRIANHVPTYEKSYFDTNAHSIEEIAMASCQAETVHFTIAVLSFLPMIMCFFFSADAAFIITSIAAALADLYFVAVQRYNRPKIIRIINRRQNKNRTE